MKLICPSCGAQCSAECFANDADARATFAALTKIPAPVLDAGILNYLALFRPVGTGRALQWRRALGLISDLAALVSTGSVQCGRAVARPCPPSVWGQAIAKMIANPPKQLPMKNHNYLVAVAYEIADERDRKREATEIKSIRRGENPHRTERSTCTEPYGAVRNFDFAALKQRIRESASHGTSNKTPDAGENDENPMPDLPVEDI
jgi:hypothetical protein